MTLNILSMCFTFFHHSCDIRPLFYFKVGVLSCINHTYHLGFFKDKFPGDFFREELNYTLMKQCNYISLRDFCDVPQSCIIDLGTSGEQLF